ncbi:MAG: peptidoglycan-binding domain-containing protein [Candidatus Paceibacterota bacterium]|jgi:hypothetical protein
MGKSFDEFTAQCVANGTLSDQRDRFPRAGHWPHTRSVNDVLGVCVHQNAGGTNPIDTAQYHTSKDNYITPGRPLPSICYPIAIVAGSKSAWLCHNLADVTWAQGEGGHGNEGDENRHLIPIVIMGHFDGPADKGHSPGPSAEQKSALFEIVEQIKTYFEFGNSHIFGHFDFGKLNCPGSMTMDWIMRQRAGQDPFGITIKDLQTYLGVAADGVVGRQTKQAICRWQAEVGLRITGTPDRFTMMMMAKEMGH